MSTPGPFFLAGGPMPTPMAPQGPMPGSMPQAGMHGIDPLQNNAPLQFNINKNQPPMAISNKPDDDKIDSRMDKKDGEGGEEMGMQNAMMGGMMGGPVMSHMMGPLTTGDPNMIMMGPMGFNQYGSFMGPGLPLPVPTSALPKDIIKTKNCTLLPPPASAPPPSTRERPPGCRTVFVGGLPENATEEIITEIFEQCGPITNIRLSKKNFAHIRFDLEECVDKAIYLSGYRMRIANSEDKPNTGRLHVDFAQARDDLYEWECKQRALAREMRHRQKLEEDRLRPPSPPPITHYNDHEGIVLQDQLKSDEDFMKATQVLITWLERGDCNRRTANSFYSMIQIVNSHIRRLLSEKGLHRQELETMKMKFRQQMEGILNQLEQIDKVFASACKQKAWDHFSKAQRKNLDVWRRQAQEIHSKQQEELLCDREEAEMEMSDSEDGDAPITKKKKIDNILGSTMVEQAANWATIQMQKDENESLKCQLEAYKNEVELLKHENQHSLDEKDKQMKSLQQALQGMQQQLITAKQEACTAKQQVRKDESEHKEKIDEEDVMEARKAAGAVAAAATVTVTVPVPQAIKEKDARLIGLISTFLHVHPFGASVDYILSYLQRLKITIKSGEIEDLLEQLPSLFRLDLHGVGASMERRWKFTGFEDPKPSAIVIS